MKKIIILIFVTIFNIAFSSVLPNEAEFKVRLKLIEPVSVAVTKHMEFGEIERGTFKQAEAEFTLRGEVGKNYNIVLSGQSKLIHTENLAQEIPVQLELEQSLQGEIENLETTFKIKGTATYAAQNQLQSGEYQGTIVVRVNYN